MFPCASLRSRASFMAMTKTHQEIKTDQRKKISQEHDGRMTKPEVQIRQFSRDQIQAADFSHLLILPHCLDESREETVHEYGIACTCSICHCLSLRNSKSSSRDAAFQPLFAFSMHSFCDCNIQIYAGRMAAVKRQPAFADCLTTCLSLTLSRMFMP